MGSVPHSRGGDDAGSRAAGAAAGWRKSFHRLAREYRDSRSSIAAAVPRAAIPGAQRRRGDLPRRGVGQSDLSLAGGHAGRILRLADRRLGTGLFRVGRRRRHRHFGGKGRTGSSVARNKLDEDIVATPAIVGNTIYVRTLRNLYAFGEPSAAPQTPQQ